MVPEPPDKSWPSYLTRDLHCSGELRLTRLQATGSDTSATHREGTPNVSRGSERVGARLQLATPDICTVPEGDGGRSLSVEPLPAQTPADKNRTHSTPRLGLLGRHRAEAAPLPGRPSTLLALHQPLVKVWASRCSEVHTGPIRQHRLSRLSASNGSPEATGQGRLRTWQEPGSLPLLP